MKIAVIISVYRDAEALRAILTALERQTERPFEVVVSEDGSSVEIADFLSSFRSSLNITHLTQDDVGWRKSRALNRALNTTRCEYVIFIDGDCVPHPSFVQNHLALSSPRHFIAAKRVFMGPKYSRAIRAGELSTTAITNSWLLQNYRDLRRDPCSSLEDALYIRPAFFQKLHVSPVPTKSLIGCNFSCFRDALVRINGFDESYVDPSVGEDDDLQWRLEATGVTLKGGRNMCIVYHMFHKKIFSDEVYKKNMSILQIKKSSGKFRCELGMSSHAD